MFVGQWDQNYNTAVKLRLYFDALFEVLSGFSNEHLLLRTTGKRHQVMQQNLAVILRQLCYVKIRRNVPIFGIRPARVALLCSNGLLEWAQAWANVMWAKIGAEAFKIGPAPVPAQPESTLS